MIWFLIGLAVLGLVLGSGKKERRRQPHVDVFVQLPPGDGQAHANDDHERDDDHDLGDDGD